MEQKRNHDALLVTLADRNFIDQAKQLFSSVYWNAGWKGDYMLLAHEIPEKDLKWFRDKGILVKKCKPLSRKMLGVAEHKHSPVVLDKFYLFTPEFKRWKNIVYLDADIIVRSSLDKLTKLKGFWAGDADWDISEQFSQDNRLYQRIKLDYNVKRPSFNSGVLVFSTDILSKNMFQEAISLFKRYKDISIAADEGILNLLFYNRYKMLPWIYATDVFDMVKKRKINPKDVRGLILHFVFYHPWKKNNPFYSEWEQNLKKADKIDLDHRPIPKPYKKNTIFFRHYIRVIQGMEKFFSNVKIRIIRSFRSIQNLLLRIIGLIGQTIKKISPRLYYKLKRKKKPKS
jgi:lipopolysaccharide biosynthesis glycosyltransferase